ncbi:MAG: DUF262 domain-containing protein [Ignavibacteriales bacterium]|nr:DUF262 domain-containing protein [Ignavibacteriales bacterium]
MNSNENISGNRLTFFQLIQEYHIQIPIIQRDYAQGRITAYEIRDSFLDALLAYLEENKKHRDLDFVYGNQSNEAIDEETKFIPLDGQQRLTTLFLLHWYLAIKDGEIDELRKHLLFSKQGESQKSKFTYETRPSSREFCDSLLLANVNLEKLLKPDEGKNNSLSKTIKDSSWYFLSWDTDPTIQSMLIMLDAIHCKFNNTSGYFQRLISLDNPVITFQFLDLKEFNLTDDLYIKMNARGIPLSPYENFKAKFEQHLKKSDFNTKHTYTLTFDGKPNQVDVKTYFSHKIDTDWANLFWNHTLADKKKFDKLIMNFIRAVVANNYATGSGNSEFLKYLIDKRNEDISFQQYSKNACLNEKTVIDLITILDLIKNGNQKVKKYLSDSFHYNEAEQFDIVVNNSFVQAGYVERIKFHAYCQYLIQWKTEKGFEDIEGLQNWMRVIYNLTENTAPYNNEKEYSNSIQGINQLISQSNDILKYISTLDKINGFDEIQFKEEKIKALLILRLNKWDELLYSVEKHGYFRGQIGFILFLSGIEEYFNTNNHCNWSKQEDNDFKAQFIKYRDIAIKIFSDKGINLFPDFVWERALLAKGDYLITEGSNQSFLINFDRDISWKRFLKRDKNHVLHSDIIKQIFNELDANNLNTSLELIKDSYSDTDWRNRFIQTPRLFNYLGGKRYVRQNSEHGFVLFSGERMSGAHAELYSYSFFLDNLEGKEFAPFASKANYYFAAGDDREERPCAYIDNWQFGNNKYAIDILYSYKQNKFKLRFFYRDIGNFKTDLVSFITNQGFSAVNESYIKYMDEQEIIESLNKLCEFLKNMESN